MNPYPATPPFNTGRLKVSDLHEIYFEEVGNPRGRPVVVIHGGPGGGMSNSARQYFDPQHYRVILFDQRGCGQSTPYAELRQNTTWDLVADMEKLRAHLKVEQWILFGGSWGSTLALLYAEANPDRALGLILRGVFLCRREEIEWFYQRGASQIFPDAWARYEAVIPPAERGDFVKAYYQRLTSEDRHVRLEAARAWSLWEGTTLTLLPDADNANNFGADQFAEAFARIECHYFTNGIWMKHDNQILAEIDRIKHLPGEIVHGRYDIVCPVKNAWDLNQAWPQSRLHIVPDAGHSAKEPGIVTKLLDATERFKTL